MPAVAFSYAVVRVVPRIEREEFVNVGVVLFSAERRHLGCRLLSAAELVARLRIVAPRADGDEIARHVEAMRSVCEGAAAAGPIATMTASERFHWLVAPRSTAIQTSPVHSGIAEDLDAALARLYDQLVVT